MNELLISKEKRLSKREKSGHFSGFGLILVLLTVALSIFMPSLHGDFVWDDKYFISENQLILGPNFLKKFLFVPFGGPNGFDENSLILGRAIKFYRPLISLSYWVDYKIWNLNPAGFHLTNILIHCLASIIIYFIYRVWGWPLLWAFFPSLLFLIFPPHFENVAWISGRTDLICFFFGSLAILFMSLFFKKGRYLWLIISSFFYLLSLFGKETSLMLPIIFFIGYWWIQKDILKAASKSLVFLPSFLIWFFLRTKALGPTNLEFTRKTVGDFLSTLGFYSSRTIFPFNLSLSVDSQRVFDNKLYLIFGCIFVFILLLSIIMVYYGRKKWVPFCFFLICYFLLLLPSVLIIFLPSTVSFIAWRFLYFPSAVAIAGGGCLLKKLIKKDMVALILVGFLSIFFIIEIYPRVSLFGKNEKDFWLSIKDYEKEDILIRYNIGFRYLSLDEEKALNIFQAILDDRHHHMHNVCELRIYDELAKYYTFKGDYEKAKKYFELLFERRPVQSLYTYFNYAFFLAKQGKKEKGEKYVNDMVQLFPANHLVLIHAANFYLLVKDYEKALEYIRKDYALFPTTQNKMFLLMMEEMIKNKD